VDSQYLESPLRRPQPQARRGAGWVVKNDIELMAVRSLRTPHIGRVAAAGAMLSAKGRAEHL